MKKFQILIWLTIGVLCSCSDDVQQKQESSPFVNIPLSENTRGAVEGNNALAFRMLNVEAEAGNEVLCPYSMFSAFAMLANGDNSESRDDILQMLGYSSDEISTLTDYCKVMNEALPEIDKSSDIRIANSIWNGSDSEIVPGFKNIVTDVFKADLFSIGLNSSEGYRQLNNWISNKTSGMIPEMLSQPMDNKVSLVNTMYFKGLWKNRFNPDYTNDKIFHNQDGTVSRVPFMHLSKSLKYLNHNNLEGVELPYGNGNFSMILIKNNNSDSDLTVNQEDWNKLLESAAIQEIDLALPKFETFVKLEWSAEKLEQLGLSKSLEKGFNGILDSQTFYFNKVLHGVTIKVDEQGTEAAAATIVNGDTAAGPLITLTFDNPFLYIIRENSTNTILFLGKQGLFNK